MMESLRFGNGFIVHLLIMIWELSLLGIREGDLLATLVLALARTM